MGEGSYDVAVLGAGPAGNAAAVRAAARGGRVCLIERSAIGGVCLNVGCMPTKAMLHASDTRWRMTRAGSLGIAPAEGRVDGPGLMRRVKDVVGELRGRAEKGMAGKKGIDVIRGQGRLTGRGTLEVATDDGPRTVHAKNVVIATGSSPVRPEGLPWDTGLLWTTDEAVVADDVPASVLVMGGGVIGSEFATMYAELGARTVVVEMLDRLLGVLDEEAGEAVAASLAERGAEVLCGRKVVSMTAGAGQVSAELDDGRTVTAERALVAVGRKANVEGIGLGAAGVHLADGIIPVDDRCRTNVENVYAAGDVAEKLQYAHLAERMGNVAGDNAMGYHTRDDRTVVPVGVYTHPEVASVGLTHEQAKEKLGRVGVFRYSYASSGTALLYEETAGQVRVLADRNTGRLHGALWIGPHATDMIHEAALALRQGLTLEQIANTIHAHPTFQEALVVVAESWLRQKRRRSR